MMVGGKEDGLPETTMCNETKTFRLFKKDNYFLGVSQRKKKKIAFELENIMLLIYFLYNSFNLYFEDDLTELFFRLFDE